MKTFIITVVLAISFLSAGAFAGNDLPQPTHKLNITVVFKNQAWPVKGQITTEAYAINRCRAA